MGKIAYVEGPESDLNRFDVVCSDRGLPLLPISKGTRLIFLFILKKKNEASLIHPSCPSQIKKE